MRTYGVIILVCGLLLSGCGEKETVTTTEPASTPPAKPTVVEQVQQSTDDVVKKATEIVETGANLVKDAADEAKQAAEKIVTTTTEGTTAAAVVAKQKTVEIVDSSKQKVVEATDQIKQGGTQLLNGLEKTPATSETPNNNLLPSAAVMASSVAIPKEVATEVQASEILVIENKNGNVTLTHAEHGKNYGCSACHSNTVPGAFELGKDTAHKLCKDCHKEQGGPTKCSGCHKK